MNKIILIGNGFDLRNGYKTDYKSFLYWFLEIVIMDALDDKHNYDELIRIKANVSPVTVSNAVETPMDRVIDRLIDGNKRSIDMIRNSKKYSILISSIGEFFKEIITHQSDFKWVDVEMSYYNVLKTKLPSSLRTGIAKNVIEQGAAKLNRELHLIKERLCKYLNVAVHDKSEIDKSFLRFINEPIKSNYILDRDMRAKCWEYNIDKFTGDVIPTNVIMVNFNYTQIPQQIYTKRKPIHIDIHGVLDSDVNPPVFGYGDEVDVVYQEMENTNINVFLDNAKSFAYFGNENYSKLIHYLGEPFAVYIWGHSCGLSDRTLLSYIFEHPNCMYIKPYYWRKTEGSDNYKEITLNISRHFKDKTKMRLRVLNKDWCEPL